MSDQPLLDTLLDAWDRNNRVLTGLLRLLPEGGLGVRAVAGGPSVGQLFTHMHFVRLVLVAEDAPEFAHELPTEEWAEELDPELIAELLDLSAQAVREAVRDRTLSGQPMKLHYDHPLLLLQHLIWHEGYHHGQIKLALKLSGLAIADTDAGRATWGVWMRKT